MTETGLDYLWSSQSRPAGRLHTLAEGVATFVVTPAGRSGYEPRTESLHRILDVSEKEKLQTNHLNQMCSFAI